MAVGNAFMITTKCHGNTYQTVADETNLKKEHGKKIMFFHVFDCNRQFVIFSVCLCLCIFSCPANIRRLFIIDDQINWRRCQNPLLIRDHRLSPRTICLKRMLLCRMCVPVTIDMEIFGFFRFRSNKMPP